MLEDGLSYPLRGDSALGRIFIGGLLGFFWFLIIPALVLFGYLIRTLEFGARDAEEPPPFDRWAGLVVSGLKGGFVMFVYGFIPILLLMLASGLTGVGLLSNNQSLGGIVGAIGIIGILGSVSLLLVLYYLIPAALTNMALENRLSAAFDFRTLKRPLLSLEYLVAWLLPLVVAFLVNIVSFMVILFTFGLGLIVIPFIQFYFQVSIFYMFGRAFGSVVDIEQLQETEVDESIPQAG